MKICPNTEIRLNLQLRNFNQMTIDDSNNQEEFSIDFLQHFVFSHYGFEHQLEKLTEELLELFIEIKLLQCGRGSIEKLKEELADVLNVAQQISLSVGNKDIENIKLKKMSREYKRIKGVK